MTTPLHLAAFYGHRDALLILIAKFRNVEVLDGQGRSPLYLASYAGKLRNVEVLDVQGRSPLYLASYAGKFRNVEVLDGQGRSPLYLASYAGKLRNVEVLDGQGRSPLYLASCTTFVWRAVILICMCYNSYPGSAMGPIRIWQSFGSGYAWIRINLPSWIQIRIQEWKIWKRNFFFLKLVVIHFLIVFILKILVNLDQLHGFHFCLIFIVFFNVRKLFIR